MKKIFIAINTIAIALIIFSCGKDHKTKEHEFDRDDFLQVQAILFSQRADNLKIALTDLINTCKTIETVNHENLETLRSSYVNVIHIWQTANYMNFGPGEELGILETLTELTAPFPVITNQIDEKILSGMFEIDDTDVFSRGLLAIEYMLYSNENVDEIVSSFTPNKLAYTKAILSKIESKVLPILEKFSTSYPNDFISNNGTSVTSSTTKVYNNWLRSYEELLELKLKKPMGLEASQSKTDPDLVESRFASLSLELMKLHFENIKEIYSGKLNGVDSIGWDDYLKSVEGGEALLTSTLAQFENVDAAFDNIPNESLQVLIEKEDASLNVLQQELTKLLPKLKSDMSSLLGIAITYSSGDGD